MADCDNGDSCGFCSLSTFDAPGDKFGVCSHALSLRNNENDPDISIVATRGAQCRFTTGDATTYKDVNNNCLNRPYAPAA